MDAIFLFCCRACLKGEGADDEYYTRLGLDDKKASTEAIKKAYKKKSLQLHPDRLAQKGITVTPEHNKQFQALKEAYDVLSDPKKRKMYDAIGANGVKLMENPQDFNPRDFIKNFQSNRADRMKIAIALSIICGIIIVMPILFCLKADGDMNNAPWLAIWTPIWCIDAVFFISAVLFVIEKEDIPESEEGDPVEEPIPFSTKIMFFIKVVLLILIQVFVFTHLDHDLEWSWFKTFSPWLVYEGVVICELAMTALSPVPPVDLSKLRGDEEQDAQEFFILQMEAEDKHFRQQVEQISARKKIINCVLRAWFAMFLALQLNDTVDWDWGLVMLPIWLIFLVDIVYSRYMSGWGQEMVDGIDMEALENGEVDDPSVMMKAQHGQELQAIGSSLCCTLFGPVLMAILLVSRLEASTFSTFIIFIPVFLVLYCCVCAVGCGFCCLSNISTDALDEEVASDDPGTAMMQNERESAEHIAEVPVQYKPPVGSSEHSNGDVESNQQYGTFDKQEEQGDANAVSSNDVDVDID